jgi:hypothetical protein
MDSKLKFIYTKEYPRSGNTLVPMLQRRNVSGKGNSFSKPDFMELFF